MTWLFDSGQTSGPDVFGGLLLGTLAQRQAASVAESHAFIRAVLDQTANLVPQYKQLPPFPAIARDLNLVVEEAVSWASIATGVRAAAGNFLDELAYQDTYRDAERLGVQGLMGLPGMVYK